MTNEEEKLINLIANNANKHELLKKELNTIIEAYESEDFGKKLNEELMEFFTLTESLVNATLEKGTLFV